MRQSLSQTRRQYAFSVTPVVFDRAREILVSQDSERDITSQSITMSQLVERLLVGFIRQHDPDFGKAKTR